MGSPLLLDDANTACHLWVSNGVLVDTKGSVWNEVGACTRYSIADLGFGSGVQAEGVGNFSIANYFITPAGANFLNPATSGFILTIISSGQLNNCGVVLDHMSPGSSGYDIANLTTMYSGNWGYIGTAPAPGLPTTVHVLSYAITSANSAMQKVDLNAAAVLTEQSGFTLSNLTPPGSTKASLGRMLPTSDTQVYQGKFFELRLQNGVTPTTAVLDAIHNSVMDPNYATIVSGAQQAGAASITQPSKFMGGFHMH